MRLINVNTGSLETFFANTPPYAILSHTWGSDEEELSYQDIQGGSTSKQGLGKLKFDGCCKQAKDDGYQYAWIDTCCIDKTNSVELGEAINSMYRWYKEAVICYALLSDVSAGIETTFRESRWFTRGWTLQELLAPVNLNFYDKDWQFLNSRTKLAGLVGEITGIPSRYLTGLATCHEASVAQRMSWAAGRSTKRVEDIAYSLFGLFDVMIPMIYGEGNKAFARLQKEIMTKTPDDSILAWGIDPACPSTAPHQPTLNPFGDAFATSPHDFMHSGTIVSYGNRGLTFGLTGVQGGLLHVRLPLHTTANGQTFGVLRCGTQSDNKSAVGIPLCCVSLGATCGEALDEYVRPINGTARMLFGLDPAIPSKSFRICEARRSDRVSSHRFQHRFLIEPPANLEIIDVYPRDRWDENQTFITVIDLKRQTVQRTFIQFRQTNSQEKDFLIGLELEFDNGEPNTHCHMMVVSRDESLAAIACLREIRDDIFGKQTAFNGALNLRATHSLKQLGQNEVFVVRLTQTIHKSSESVDASAELRLYQHGVVLQRSIDEDFEIRPKFEVISASLVKKQATADLAKKQLDDVSKRLRQLQDRNVRLERHLQQATQEFESQVEDTKKLQVSERSISEFLSTARELPDSYGIDRATRWNQAMIEKLSLKMGSPQPEYAAMVDETERLFMQMITRGYLAGLSFLIGGLRNLNFEDSQGRGVLLTAIRAHETSIAGWLIDQGVDVNRKSSGGLTPLGYTALHDYTSEAEFLLNRGASVDARSAGKSGAITPLLAATMKGSYSTAKLLLEYEAFIDFTDDLGHTALSIAAREGYYRIAAILIAHRANSELQNERGDTPLSQAALNNHTTIVQLLLKKGANIGSRNRRCHTPLMGAVLRGHGEAVSILLDAGSNTECLSITNNTALGHAAFCGNEKMVKLLLDRGALINPPNARSPLFLAAMDGHVPTTQLLIAQGTDVNFVDKTNNSILTAIVRAGQMETSRLFLANGANKEIKDDKGTPLLIVATSQGHDELVDLLLAFDVNTDSRDALGQTALFPAIEQKSERMVTSLIDRGAKVDAKRKDGLYALHWAVLHRHRPSVKILLDRGADAAKENADGKSAWQYARSLIRTSQTSQELHEIIQLLERNGNRRSGTTKPGTTGKQRKNHRRQAS